MLLFEPNIFKEKLRSASSIKVDDTDFFGIKTELLPREVENFHKIMVAKTKEDLDDISLEDIINAFNHIETLESYYTCSTSHTNRALPSCLKRLQGSKSVLNRRVL